MVKSHARVQIPLTPPKETTAFDRMLSFLLFFSLCAFYYLFFMYFLVRFLVLSTASVIALCFRNQNRSAIITLLHSPHSSHISAYNDRTYFLLASFVPLILFQQSIQNSATLITSYKLYQICIAFAMHI